MASIQILDDSKADTDQRKNKKLGNKIASAPLKNLHIVKIARNKSDTGWDVEYD
jgi:hypothetical protein